MKIRIKADTVIALAELNETPSAKIIAAALPITAAVSLWGDEIYFPIPAHCALEDDAKKVVSLGDLGYWPQGDAFCIFFGPTPISRKGEIKPASAVNLIGRIIGDARVFKQVHSGAEIIIEKLD
jgi:uncharacterized protein